MLPCCPVLYTAKPPYPSVNLINGILIRESSLEKQQPVKDEKGAGLVVLPF